MSSSPTIRLFETGHSTPYDLIRVHHFFERTAKAYPHYIALIYGDVTLTYSELYDLSGSVAAHLSQRNVREGSRVAIMLERGPGMIAAILGILKLGGIYVPIDPAFPEQRIRLIVEDSNPLVVITEPQWIDRWKAVNVQTCMFSDILFQEFKSETVQEDIDAPIYIIYTSGTTGRPKGIIQTHRAITNLIQWQNKESAIDFSGAVLQFSSIGFDVHLQEVFSTFFAGGRLCLIQQEERIDTDLLLATIKRNNVSVLFLSVSALNGLFYDKELLEKIPDCVTDIITAGEQLIINPHLKAFMAEHPEFRLHNHYGVSESHVVTALTLSGLQNRVRPSIGRPISNTVVLLKDENGIRITEVDKLGEIWIAGDCLAERYLNLPEKTQELFVYHDGRRWYRTGDFARWNVDGELDFEGRKDDQVKISGHLVILSDVETTLSKYHGINSSVVIARDIGDERRLLAYFVTDSEVGLSGVRKHMAELLPDFMVPSFYIQVPEFPIAATGKVDKDRLPFPTLERKPNSLHQIIITPEELQILNLLEKNLGVSGVMPTDMFAEVGATSLTLIRTAAELSKELGRSVSPIIFYEYPNARLLSGALHSSSQDSSDRKSARQSIKADGIAIIGMAGRFPGADSVDELWKRILANEDLLTDLVLENRKRAPLLPAGGTENLVLRAGIVRDVERFDAEFFGFSKRDAEWLDPQQRQFLEIVWACFEDAAIDTLAVDARIGVFAGMAESAYFFNIRPRIGTMADNLAAVIGNDKDFIASRVAHKLGLTGPAVNVQSACSTGLLTVYQACEAIQAGSCEMAIAGASSIQLPQESGYYFEPEGIYSPDGLTRPFDEAGTGTNMTNAVAAVLLKSLSQAVKDGDHIYSVIRGIAANNDGNRKVNFTAPSVEGQEEVIVDAMAMAGVSGDDIAFVEAHGTGTALGDPIELRGLTRAFKRRGITQNSCALSSIKSRLGHTNRAAGVVGLIAASKALETGVLPGMANFSAPNPRLEISETPFYVPIDNTALNLTVPLHAGVSSFGVGGTNVHAVLQAPPQVVSRTFTTSSPQIIPISGRTESAVRKIAGKIKSHVQAYPAIRLDDIATTFTLGRKELEFRSFIMASNSGELIEQLTSLENGAKLVQKASTTKKIAFLFSGTGPQYTSMGQGLFRTSTIFREVVIDACAYLKDVFGTDYLPWFEGQKWNFDHNKSQHVQPLLFIIEVGLSHAVLALGLKPELMLGLSGGDFACAHLAGVMEFHDALGLLVLRGQLMDEIAPAGLMVSVLVPSGEMPPVTDGVYLAGKNSRIHYVYAGSIQAVEQFQIVLQQQGFDFRVLFNKNPNHTPLMEEMAQKFVDAVSKVKLRSPNMQFVSSATGKIASPDELISPEYWGQHICNPILFADGLDVVLSRGCDVLIELGPRDTLCQLAQAHSETSITTIPFMQDGNIDEEASGFLSGLGKLWQCGLNINWKPLFAEGIGKRISLPTYPFEGEKHWIDWQEDLSPHITEKESLHPLEKSEWLQQRSIRKLRPHYSAAEGDLFAQSSEWGILGEGDKAERLAAVLKADNITVMKISEPIDSVLLPKFLVVITENNSEPILNDVLSLIQRCVSDPISRRIWFVSFGGKDNYPDSGFSTLALTVSQEVEHLDCRALDFSSQKDDQFPQLVAELAAADTPEARTVMFRNGQRLTETLTLFAPPPNRHAACFHHGGIYLLSGGLGDVGTAVAIELAKRYGPRLAIIGRTRLDTKTISSKRAFKRLAAINEAGAETLYLPLDITNKDDVQNAVQKIIQQWGKIDGVIHLAAAINGEEFVTFIPDLKWADFERQLLPKLKGLEILDEVLVGQKLDFKIVFGSLATFLGGLGYTAYAYTNRRILAWCGQALGSAENKWTCISWDVWKKSNNVVEPRDIQHGSSMAKYAIDPVSGVDILERVLAAGASEATVITVAAEGRLQRVANSLKPNAPLDIDGSIDEDYVTRMVSQAWKKYLSVEIFDQTASFLECGGDSLTALRVALDLRRSLAAPVTASLLLKTPRFEEFCAALREFKTVKTYASPIEKRPMSEAEETRASPLQTRWYKMAGLGYGNLLMPVLVEGELDAIEFLAAIKKAIYSFEVLRTTYFSIDGLVHQRVGSNPCTFDHLDFRGAAYDRQIQQIKTLIHQLESRQFQINKVPPIEGMLIELSSQHSLLLIKVHHICFDGWSASLLVEAIDRFYAGHGAQPSLEYADFSFWHWKYLESVAAERIRNLWRDVFYDAPIGVCRPIPDQKSSDERDATARKITSIFSAENTNKLRISAAHRGTTLFGIIMSAFVLALADSTGNLDLIFGTTSSGRDVPGSESIMGVFVNPLPLRVRLDADDSLSTVVDKVRAVVDLFQNSPNYPLADLVENVPYFKGFDLNQTFRSYLLYQNYRKPQTISNLAYSVAELEDEPDTKNPYLSIFSEETTTLMRDFELIIFDKEDGSLSCNFWYRTALYTEGKIKKFSNAFETALEKLCKLNAESLVKEFIAS